MKMNTSRFGEIEINEDLIFEFESPIIGYNEYSKYMLIEHDENSCFKWLQSLDDPDLAFPVTSTTFFGIEYNFEIPDENAEKIGLEKVEDLLVLNIASIPTNNPKNTTINLRAPIIVNMTNLKAMQMILENDSFKIKHPLFNQFSPKTPKKGG